MNIARSLIKMFGAQLISSAANFIGLIIFARAIGAHQLGVYFLFQAVVSVLLVPADAGLRGAMEKRISENQQGANYLSTTVLMKFAPVTIISLGIFAFQNQINAYVGLEIAIWIFIAIIINEIYYILKYSLRGELKVGYAADMMAIRQSVWLISGIITTVVFGLGAIGLVYSYVLGALIAIFYGLFFRSTSFGVPTMKAARSLFNYAKFEMIAGTGAKLFSWFDVLIIGFFLTQAAVGAYETAWRLSAAAIMFGMAIRVTIFPQFSNWSDSGDFERISNMLTKMITASLFFVIPAFIGTLILSQELLTILFGEEFAIASIALVILMGHRIFEAFNQTIGRTLQAIDQPDLAAYATAVGVILNVSLNIILIPIFGIEGAAVATLVSFASMTIIRAIWLARSIRIQIAVTDVGWCVVSATVMGIVIYISNLTFSVEGELELLSLVGLGAAIYFIVILYSSSLRTQVVEGMKSAAQ